MFAYNKPIKLPDRNSFYLQIGNLEVWLIKQKESIAVSYSYSKEYVSQAVANELDSTPLFPESSWQRYMTGKENSEIIISPVWNEQPVVVRPSMPVVLPPHNSMLLFVELPITLQISLAEKSLKLCSIMTSQLSNTWFGSIEEGALCLALKTPAKNHFEDLLSGDSHVVMPLSIVNKSSQDLSFQRLLLSPSDLAILKGESMLWTSCANVHYHGKDKWSRISFESKRPAYEKIVDVLRKGSTKSSGFLTKTFDSLLSYANF